MRLQIKKFRKMFPLIFKTLLLTGMKENSYSAITSNQICMYISKDRHKNHVPCGWRQLIKPFESLKHAFKKRTRYKILFNTAKDQPASQNRNLLAPGRGHHWQGTCLGSSNHQNPLGIYIPGVCIFKTDIRRLALRLSRIGYSIFLAV